MESDTGARTIGRAQDPTDDCYQDVAAGIGRRIGDVTVDEDDVQEAVVRYWEQLAHGRPIRYGPAWVRTVARNLALSEARRRQAEARAVQRMGREEHQPAGLGVDPAQDHIRNEIARLPARQREIVVLYYYGDLSVAEVATRTGCREGTVKATLHQARRALAAALQPEAAATRTEDGTMRLAHWGITGTHAHEHELERTPETFEGHPVAVLRCVVKDPGGFGAQVQRFEPGSFRRHRVRFSGMLRAEDVTGWAGLWMRVDGDGSPSTKRTLAFYNNQDRGLTGTTGWVRQDAVLDVADEGTGILIGAILSGSGSLYVADFHVDIVGSDVPLTLQRASGSAWLPHPTNLSFAETM